MGEGVVADGISAGQKASGNFHRGIARHLDPRFVLSWYQLLRSVRLNVPFWPYLAIISATRRSSGHSRPCAWKKRPEDRVEWREAEPGWRAAASDLNVTKMVWL